ncbi:MAG: hypothetical protein E7356_01700 [Clostridiales bacterium]|nr:hypothetical protein [Clostridiales bacterium]
MEEKNKNVWKTIGVCLLYPHLAVIICLLPIATVLLVLSLIYLGTESVLAILSYLLAFYVLLVICFRIPRIVAFFKKVKHENKYVKRWFSDVHLRVNVSLYGTLIWNVIFATFQLGLGIYHKSFWFYSMFAYYVILGVMRFFLLKHTRKYKANEEAESEIKKSILCGYLLIAINLALALIVFFMVYWNRTFHHHMITTIAIAAYTFFTFTFAIINLVRYKKYKSPVYSSAKTISLIAGAVSMLTLETTMLTTFGTTEGPLFNQIMLTLTGVAVIAFAITMAIIMIVKGHKKLKVLKETIVE